MVYHILKGVRALPKLSSSGEKQRVTFYANCEKYRDLKIMALKQGRPVAELLNLAIDECLKTNGNFK